MIERCSRSILVLSALGAAFAAAAGAPDLVFMDGLESEAPLPAECASDGPMFPPEGYQRTFPITLLQLWQQTTGGNAISADLATIRLEAGQYSSFRFDRSMLPSEFYQFKADTSNTGVGLAPATYRFVTISTCPGDLRRAAPASDDPTLQPPCRTSAAEGTFLYINWGEPDARTCNLDSSREYYFNVIFDNPVDGYDATNPCNDNGQFACGFRVGAFQ